MTNVLLVGACPGAEYTYSTEVLRAYVAAQPDLCEVVDVRTFQLDFTYERLGRLLCGFDREVLDPLLDQVLGLAPDVVGFSVYIWNRPLMMAASRAVRACAPSAHLILGGPEVSYKARQVLANYSWIDSVAIGEGESTMAELLRSIFRETGRKWHCVPSLCFRDDDGNAVLSDAGSALIDPNDLPSPILGGQIPNHADALFIESYRGCPKQCGFCLYHRNNRRIRRHRQSKVLAEIAEALKRRVRLVHFTDAMFGIPGSDSEVLLDKIIENYNGITAFEFEVHVEALADGVLERLGTLHEIGAIHRVEVGVQSIADEAGRIIGRRVQLDKFENAYWRLRERVPSGVQIDLLYGLPGETWESFNAGLDWVARLKPDYIAAFPLQVLDGSPLQRDASEFGLEDLGSVGGHFAIACGSFSAFAMQRAGRMRPVIETGFHLYRHSVTRWLEASSEHSFARLADSISDAPDQVQALEEALRAYVTTLSGSAQILMTGLLDYETKARRLIDACRSRTIDDSPEGLLATAVEVLDVPAGVAELVTGQKIEGIQFQALVLRGAGGSVFTYAVTQVLADVLRISRLAKNGSELLSMLARSQPGEVASGGLSGKLANLVNMNLIAPYDRRPCEVRAIQESLCHTLEEVSTSLQRSVD